MRLRPAPSMIVPLTLVVLAACSPDAGADEEPSAAPETNSQLEPAEVPPTAGGGDTTRAAH